MRLPDMERNLVAKCGPQPGSVCLWRGWMPGTTGFVFSLERLATGAAGFILAGLLGVAVSAGAGRLMVTQEPVAIVVAVLLIVIGVLTVPLVLICTNALVARSVVLEVLEGSGQTRQDGVAFVKRNLKTLFLYALVIVGGILAALVLETLLVLIGAIPTVGPILFGLLLFPLCVALSIAAILGYFVLIISLFVFPAHVATEEAPLMRTVKELAQLVRLRWLRIAGSQLVASVGALALGLLFAAVCVYGIIATVSLWGIAGFAHVDPSDLLKANSPQRLFRMLSALAGGSGPVAAFSGALVGFWLVVIALAVISFLPTYMSVAGALTYLSTRGVAPVRLTPEASSRMPEPGGAAASVPAITDIGGVLGNREVPIPAAGLKIGRDAACDLVIDSPGVSREHTWIEVTSGRIVVRDLQSTNGTFVNGERIGELEVRSGDEIQLGDDEGARFVVSV